MADPVNLEREAAEQIWRYMETLNSRLRSVEAIVKALLEAKALGREPQQGEFF